MTPKFDTWVEDALQREMHNADDYNNHWREFLESNPLPDEILVEGRRLMYMYKLNTNF